MSLYRKRRFGFAGASGGESPGAIDVWIDGYEIIGETLEGRYTYNWPAPESGTTYQWYRADDAVGTNRAAISGETASSYTVTTDDIDKYLQFEVVPSDGVTVGSPAVSAYTNRISNALFLLAAENGTIIGAQNGTAIAAY